MDAQRFLEEFGHIASAPGGVQRLRELVLYLAIHGKLNVAHEAGTLNDAYELIAQTDQLKQLMREAGEARKEAPLPSLPSNTTIKYPSHWVVARLGTVVHLISGQHLRPDEQNTVQQGIPYLTGASDFGTVYPVISRWTKVKKAVAKQSDILIAVKGTIGKINILNLDEAAIGRQLMAIRALAVNPRFIALILRCHENYFLTKSIGIAIPGISREDILHLAIGVPPLKEQVSIVAKVDELMALCDKLEAQQQDRRKLQNALRQSTLQAVAAATSPHELQTTWARLAENFRQLFHTPEDVAELRKMAVELAIRGDLDEPDSQNCDATFDQLLAEFATRKRGKRFAKLAIMEELFSLPSGWRWVLLEEILADSESGWSPKCDAEPRRPGEWGVLKVSAVTWGEFRPEENKRLPPSMKPRVECEVKPGDFLLSRANTAELVARSVIVPNDCPSQLLMSDKIVRLNFLDESLKAWTNLVNNSGYAREYYRTRATGTSDSMRNVSRQVIHELPIPLPPIKVQKRILRVLTGLMRYCDALESQLRHANELVGRLATAAVSSLTGIAIEKEEDDSMKAPQTELIAQLRLGQAPDTKAHAPLATILARHNGEMAAKDLWQRFGGEIDAFYAQLKLEVSKGWIREPAVAEMRVAEAD